MDGFSDVDADAERTPLRTLLTWRAFGYLCTFGLLATLVRRLTLDEFGVISLALSWQGVLTLCALEGAKPALLRASCRDPGGRNRVLTTYLRLGLLAGAAVVVTASLGVAWFEFSGDERTVLWVAALGVLPAAIDLGPRFDAERRQREAMAISTTCEAAALAAIVLAAVGGRLSVVLVVAVLTLRNYGVWIVQAWRLPLTSEIWRTPGVGEAAAMFRSAAPITLTQMVGAFPQATAVFLARVVLGPSAVGQLGIAVQIAGVYAVFASVAGRQFAPIAFASDASTATIREVAWRNFRFATGLWILASGCAAALLGWGLGEAYRAALVPAQMALVAVLFQAYGGVAAVWLVAQHRERRLLAGAATGAGVFLAACATLVWFPAPTTIAAALLVGVLANQAVLGSGVVRRNGVQQSVSA